MDHDLCKPYLRNSAAGMLIMRWLLWIVLIAALACLGGCESETGGEGGSGSGSHGSMKKKADGMSMRVDEASGRLEISRPGIKNPVPMGEEGTWTILVYLCGSDLESKILFGGMGSADIEEMCAATASSKVRFVIETGGSGYWHNDKIDSDVIGRYVIEKGKMKAVDKSKKASMGKASTLSSFLDWGIRTYPAGKMGLVFWDHGGGSLSGVCFDELADNDSLSLREIDAAILSTLKKGHLTDHFEFIGFDACLMGTVETANIAASYADYMIASEESEPGSGWDYTAIGNYLAENPQAGGADVGKVICDSYKEQCEKAGDGQIATMSVVDLSKVDGLLADFNTFAREMYKKSEKKDKLASMVRQIRAVDNFGGNNKAEGYTNMVDLGGLISSAKDWAKSAESAAGALDQAVVYKISGSDHKKASGLSVYYPLSIGDSRELDTFESVCVSPYYLSFVGRQGYGSVHEGNTEDYDEDETVFEDGFWSWIDSFLFDEETGDYDYNTEESCGNWDYLDDHDSSAQSSLITFEEEPGMNEDGEFCLVLDEEGEENTSDVLALVYQEQEDGTMIELGETWDLNVDWDTGYVSDQFDGYWLSLPDGQNLATYIVDVTDDYVIYTSPVLLNDQETYLRFRKYHKNGKIKVEGAWDGIDEEGASARDIIKLKKGDVITPAYYCIDEKGKDQEEYEGQPYTIKEKSGKPAIRYDYIYEGDYAYAFCITDVYGDDYITDPAEFNV